MVCQHTIPHLPLNPSAHYTRVMLEAVVLLKPSPVELTPPPPRPMVSPDSSQTAAKAENPHTPSPSEVFTDEFVAPGNVKDAELALSYNANLTPESTATSPVTFGESTTTESVRKPEPITSTKTESPPTATKVEIPAESVTTTTEQPEINATVDATQAVEPAISPTTTTAAANTEVSVTAETKPLAKAEMDKMFQEASSLLLELKDFRVYLTSLAQNLGDTPLAGEFRHNVLNMIRNLPEGLIRDIQKQPQLLARLKALKSAVPEGYAQHKSDQLADFLTSQQANHPEITPDLIINLREGKLQDTQIIFSLAKDNNTSLGQDTLAALGTTKDKLQASINKLAKSTGKEGWLDNWEAIRQEFLMKHPKLAPHLPSWAELKAMAPGCLMMFGMALMLFQQVLPQEDSGQRQGH